MGNSIEIRALTRSGPIVGPRQCWFHEQFVSEVSPYGHIRQAPGVFALAGVFAGCGAKASLRAMRPCLSVNARMAVATPPDAALLRSSVGAGLQFASLGSPLNRSKLAL